LQPQSFTAKLSALQISSSKPLCSFLVPILFDRQLNTGKIIKKSQSTEIKAFGAARFEMGKSFPTPLIKECQQTKLGI
jgi:hypothetical protein